MIVHVFSLSPFLLLTTPLAAVMAQGPPLFVNLPIQVQDKFAADNFVRKDFKDLPLQAVGIGNKPLVTNVCGNGNGGRVVSLSGLEPSTVMGLSTRCFLDDQQVVCPDPLVFTKQEGDVKITVSKNPNFPEEIETVQVVVPGCGSETFLTVVPGWVTSIPAEAYDEEELSKYVYGDVDALMNGLRHRNLRSSSAKTTTHHHRALQGCPSKSIKLALAFDSSYCTTKGSYSNAVVALTTAVAGVAALYEGSTCLTVTLGHIEGYCTAATDVYKPGVDTNLSGCGNEGILDFFQDYWNANRASVDRDLAHFAGGTGLECDASGCVIGCGYVKSMCSNPGASYGVNYMTFSTNQALLNSLLAHEMGHNAGSGHDTSDNAGGVDLSTVAYIMEPYINNGADGFSPYSQNEFTIQPQGCLDAVTIPPTQTPATAPPTQSPTTAVPTQSPTTAVPTTTAPTTESPTTTPPTESPTTAAPTESPTTALPTQSPTTAMPTTLAPTDSPTTALPTQSPTTALPTAPPTESPTTAEPTQSPTTAVPTSAPTEPPTSAPTEPPTTALPTAPPTESPTTAAPTQSPTTVEPTPAPTEPPTPAPTDPPTPAPTEPPTPAPTEPPTTPCFAWGESCASDADCCSNKCRGPNNRMTCK